MLEKLPLPGTLRLTSGNVHLDVAPDAGGSIARLFEISGSRVFHWLRPASAEAVLSRNPDLMASFPLVPFCNRIRDGRFRFRGVDVQLPPAPDGRPHSLHGTVRHLSWQVGSHDRNSVLLYVDHARGAWPWHFAAAQHYSLDVGVLRVAMSVTNLDRHPMPVGLGHHPYLPNRYATRIRTSVRSMWATDEDVLPTDLVHPPFLQELRSGMPLSRLNLDNNFVGWERSARVDWPMDKRALILSAESPLDYFVLYCPSNLEHFCIEAVSNCTDWLNLRDDMPTEAIGGAILLPGEHIEARFSFHMERTDG